MNKNKKLNVVLADYGESKDNGFVKGLEVATGKRWHLISWKNNGLRKNKFSTLARYLGYFTHPFGIFLRRGGYRNIVAWQQFYGLIFAFYCSLFHVKKQNRLIVMTFIYKDKSGAAGRIYKKFVSRAVKSKYIDKLVVFSRAEVDYYAKLFGVSADKFQYFPLGLEEAQPLEKTMRNLKKPFLLSVGRSNRDYPFLFRCAEDLPYQFVVLTDSLEKDATPSKNVTVFNDVGGDEYLKILAECEAVLIPLKDPNISSGQLVILQAMRGKKAIVITRSEAVKDYVTDGVDAMVVPKDEKVFCSAAVELMENEELRKTLAENGRKAYEEKFSIQMLGERVGRECF